MVGLVIIDIFVELIECGRVLLVIFIVDSVDDVLVLLIYILGSIGVFKGVMYCES